MREKFASELEVLFRENGVPAEPNQIEKLAYYAELVLDKNEEVNLISRKDTASIIENHVFHSALITKYIPERTGRFLDIGTGGGFPGIPLGIIFGSLKGVLVDSTGKKIEAVKSFISSLMLGNLTAESARAESPEFKEKYKDAFDLIVSRATAPLIVLLRYAIPVMKNKALMIAFKGGDITDEIKTAETKYKAYIKKLTVLELKYKPGNIRNEKEKKLVLIELTK
ncbi:MAG TPA: 16S rRNA (guanine(527)-N(7))-methyltransferase RsmG [Ignavibacteriales bacterium]|nr:16S rRNA (guanine(527)-N(7))-methyltransferase RsmG [Ignavibacteriales bacterium]